MNTSEFLMIAGAIVPDRAAMLFDNEQVTFVEFQERVNALANALADRGVGAGDRVALMQVNTPQCIEVYFAAAQLDAIYVPINFRAKSEELEQMLAIAQPKALFVGERYLPLVPTAGDAIPEQVVVLDGEAPGGAIGYQEFLEGALTDQLHFPEGDDDDTTVIMFTAGTTGVPKGVMLSHESFSGYLLATVNPADPESEETNLLTVPLYHIAGLQAALAAVYGGRTLAIMRQFDPEEWMDVVQRHRANRAMLVPTMLKHLMDHPRFGEYDLSSLDVITYGAAPMPMEVIRDAIGKFPNARFINAFGQTETASTITMLPPEDHVLDGGPVGNILNFLFVLGQPEHPLHCPLKVDGGGTGRTDASGGGFQLPQVICPVVCGNFLGGHRHGITRGHSDCRRSPDPHLPYGVDRLVVPGDLQADLFQRQARLVEQPQFAIRPMDWPDLVHRRLLPTHG